MTIVRSLLILWLGGVGCVLPAFGRPAEDTAESDSGTVVLVGRLLQPDGTLQDRMTVVVRAGRITRVSQEADGDGLPLHQLPPESVICPGLLELFALPGVVGQAIEDAQTVDPDASPARALDPSHRDFRAALEAGITAVMVGPAATNLVSGVCVTVRTHVPDGRLDMLREDGPLLLAFGDGVWRPDRAPTSRGGAMHELRGLLAQARAGSAHPRLTAAVRGELDAWIACATGEDVAAMELVLGDVREHFGLVVSQDALDVVDDLRSVRAPVVLGPYTMETSRRELLGAATLAEGGGEVAFRAGFPVTGRDALRLTASLAVRHGMDPAAARRAITIAPAKVAGVADRIGSIAPGKDADLVVFSADPLRMDARVLEVYVRGQRVYCTRNQLATVAGEQP